MKRNQILTIWGFAFSAVNAFGGGVEIAIPPTTDLSSVDFVCANYHNFNPQFRSCTWNSSARTCTCECAAGYEPQGGDCKKAAPFQGNNSNEDYFGKFIESTDRFPALACESRSKVARQLLDGPFKETLTSERRFEYEMELRRERQEREKQILDRESRSGWSSQQRAAFFGLRTSEDAQRLGSETAEFSVATARVAQEQVRRPPDVVALWKAEHALSISAARKADTTARLACNHAAAYLLQRADSSTADLRSQNAANHLLRLIQQSDQLNQPGNGHSLLGIPNRPSGPEATFGEDALVRVSADNARRIEQLESSGAWTRLAREETAFVAGTGRVDQGGEIPIDRGAGGAVTSIQSPGEEIFPHMLKILPPPRIGELQKQDDEARDQLVKDQERLQIAENARDENQIRLIRRRVEMAKADRRRLGEEIQQLRAEYADPDNKFKVRDEIKAKLNACREAKKSYYKSLENLAQAKTRIPIAEALQSGQDDATTVAGMTQLLGAVSGGPQAGKGGTQSCARPGQDRTSPANTTDPTAAHGSRSDGKRGIAQPTGKKPSRGQGNSHGAGH